MKRHLTQLHRLVPFALAALLAACGGDPAPTPPAASAAIPDSFALASEPAGARPLADVIAGLAGSAEVVARGNVGQEGGAAYFTLADPSLQSCIDMGDECKTPWDYCCTSADEQKSKMATVELRSGGTLIDGSVLGWNGLDHLKEVVVSGTATKDAAGNVTIVAKGIWVKA